MRRMDEMEPCSAEDSRDGTDGQMHEKDHRRVDDHRQADETDGWTIRMRMDNPERLTKDSKRGARP